MMESALLGAMPEALSDQALGRTVLTRRGERVQAIEVNAGAIWEGLSQADTRALGEP